MALSVASQLSLFQPLPATSKDKSSVLPLPNRIAQPATKLPILACGSSQKHQTQSMIDLLRAFSDEESINQVKAVHGFVLKSDFSGRDLIVLLNHLAHAYSKCSNFNAACQVFDEMPEKNTFSWTVMIIASTENGLFLDGLCFFLEMLDHGSLPDKFTFSSVLQTCIGLENVEIGTMIHAQVIMRGFASHTVVATSVLNMYAKLDKIEDAYQVFSTMTEHNVVSWNAMISGFASNGQDTCAYNLFERMTCEGVSPDLYTLLSVSKVVGRLGDVNKCAEVQKFVSQLGLESNVRIGTAMIEMYGKYGSLYDAVSTFDLYFSNSENNAPWNAMISTYSQCGFYQEALKLYVKMCKSSIPSDVYTFCSVFNAVAALKWLGFCREVHGLVLKSGEDVLVTDVQNAVADAYAKSGALEDVRKIFYQIKLRDVVSWTTFVTACSQSSEWEEALLVFSLMREGRFVPNQFTFSSVLVSCASLCFLEYGQQIHGLLVKLGLDTSSCVQSALIDMYSKCGSIVDAQKVFSNLSGPDTITWTAIISAYAQHGLAEAALDLFRMMEQSGTQANEVTFLCVLFACSHRGLVDTGLQYFQLMEVKYGVTPEMEHYACIVDLLGRVGRFDHIIKFINDMPFEPDEIIWQSLLGACRVHGNVELGQIAAKKILAIRPDDPATFVLLSKIYSESGRFGDGIGLRLVMKEQGMKMEPGYSWILINGRVHKFYAGDQQHPHKDEIYASL